MGEEYPAKSFMSGNSVAIRIPAALGVEPNREWVAYRNDDGDLVITPKAKRTSKIDPSGIYGSIPNLGPISPENRVLEGAELDWHGGKLKRG